MPGRTMPVPQDIGTVELIESSGDGDDYEQISHDTDEQSHDVDGQSREDNVMDADGEVNDGLVEDIVVGSSEEEEEEEGERGMEGSLERSHYILVYVLQYILNPHMLCLK